MFKKLKCSERSALHFLLITLPLKVSVLLLKIQLQVCLFTQAQGNCKGHSSPVAEQLFSVWYISQQLLGVRLLLPADASYWWPAGYLLLHDKRRLLLSVLMVIFLIALVIILVYKRLHVIIRQEMAKINLFITKWRPYRFLLRKNEQLSYCTFYWSYLGAPISIPMLGCDSR
jgi:hypothetical protein